MEPLTEEQAPRTTKQEHPEIGDQLRARRRQRGLSLRGLAEKLGVSPSLISQIERGQSNPSVSTLYAIVNELDVSLDELLFNDRRPAAVNATAPTPLKPTVEAPRHPVQRADSRKSFRLASGVTWERLTTTSEPGAEFLYVVYDVDGASSMDETFQRHAGHEWAYIISGTLQVTIGFEEYVLEAGDALSLASTIPHRLVNIGDEPVHAVWFELGRVPFDPVEIDPTLGNGSDPAS